MSSATAMNSSLTAEYVNPVLASTRNVFETMLGCTPKRTGLALSESTSSRHELSATIGISGKVMGTIVVSLSRTAALNVFKRIVGTEAEDFDADVCDTVGELTNMIAGSAKSQLERLDLSISLPNIVSGKDHAIHFPSNVQPICISYESELGPFSVEVGFSALNE